MGKGLLPTGLPCQVSSHFIGGLDRLPPGIETFWHLAQSVSLSDSQLQIVRNKKKIYFRFGEM